MKKIVFSSILLGALAVSSFADGGFIGFDGGYDFKTKIGDAQDKRPNLGIKGGFDFDNYKVYGGYSYSFEAEDKVTDGKNEAKAKWKSHKLLIGADFTPEIASDFKLVAGAYTGLAIIDVDLDIAENNKQTKLTGKNLKGWVLGGKLGGAFEVDKNNEIELGLKVEKVFYKDYDYFDKMRETNYGLYVGYNYKF